MSSSSSQSHPPVPAAKRSRSSGPAASAAAPPSLLRDPTSILSWNANGLAPRCKSPADISQFVSLLQTTHRPDLICIQEARLKARSSDRRDVPSEGDLDAVRPLLSVTDDDYIPVWSLADGRRAGTLTLLRRTLLMDGGDGGGSGSGTPGGVADSCAFSVEGALELTLRAYGLDGDEELRGLVRQCSKNNSGGDNSNSSSNGNAKKKQQQQTSLMAFMKAKPKPASSSGSNNSTTSSSAAALRRHNDEGRIQFLRFDTLDVLHTYVPNNGTNATSFQRRRDFDADVQSLLTTRRAILRRAGDEGRAMLWVGDLNVARTYLDGTHHTVAAAAAAAAAPTAPNRQQIHEYWTDPSKCPDCKRQPNPGDVGIPGFTPNERRRFETLLTEGQLVDVWRHVHPDGVVDDTLPHLGRHGGTAERSLWDRANYTWRGTSGKNAERGRYQGKGQRIDYFLLSDQAMDRVESCDILGYGEHRGGYFCGSDHCPLVLTMKMGNEDGGDGRKKSKQEEKIVVPSADNGNVAGAEGGAEQTVPSKDNVVDLTLDV